MFGRPYSALKRAADVVGGGVLLVVLAPLLLVVALAVRLSSPGPALFTQLRAGRGGKPFTIYKFRSMRPGVAEQESWVEAGDWTRVPDDFVFKTATSHSDRITPIGRILRATSLDELPQLLNVLKGDMGLVGPRPEILPIAEKYDALQSRRLQVRPGVTGWAQVNGRASHNHATKIAADLYYVDHASPLLDARILLMTARRLFSSSGAF